MPSRRETGSRTWPLGALLALSLPRPALAAIAVDADTSATGSTASLSWSHTVGSGPNRFLIVETSDRDGNKTVSGTTYGALSSARAAP
jgi:hypothetical protein